MKEFRCLVFTDAEVMTAFVERRRRLREPLPVGTIADVGFTSGPDGLQTGIRIVDDYGHEERLAVRAAEIAAALVDYCLNRKILLPTGSKRWVEVIGKGEVTLLMTLDGFSRRKALLPRRRLRLAPARGAVVG